SCLPSSCYLPFRRLGAAASLKRPQPPSRRPTPRPAFRRLGAAASLKPPGRVRPGPDLGPIPPPWSGGLIEAREAPRFDPWDIVAFRRLGAAASLKPSQRALLAL